MSTTESTKFLAKDAFTEVRAKGAKLVQRLCALSGVAFGALRRGVLTALRSAPSAAFLTILVTLIGLVGGLYADEIRSYYPWCFIEKTQCNNYVWEIGGFYGALAVFAILFYVRELAISVHAEKREVELLAAIRTMPPTKVMQAFAFAYKLFLSRVEQSDAIAKAGAVGEAEEINEGIRNGLDAMTVLAAEFQRVPNARYAANIMLFRSTSDIPAEEHQAIFERLGPFVDCHTLEGLAGILDLIPELSASTDDQDDSFDPDPSLKPMALPVPKEERSKNNGQKRYLPGAPTALIEGRYLIDDTHRLSLEYETQKEYDLPPGIFQQIDSYFHKTEAGRAVRSFMSLMLYYRQPGTTGNENTIGVVNIHSDQVNLFASRELAAQYESLCQPFILGLARMIQNRKVLQEQTVSKMNEPRS